MVTGPAADEACKEGDSDGDGKGVGCLLDPTIGERASSPSIKKFLAPL